MPQHSDSLTLPNISVVVGVFAGYVVVNFAIFVLLSNGGR